MTWETVIGLELHVQLLTHSKLFSGADTNFGADPNTQACAVDLGLPGTLPVVNKKAIELAIKFALATHATVAQTSIFARKNYFYPDLPKGYQISQYEHPIVSQGYIDINLDDVHKRINITRAHLEEDAGKSIHDNIPNMTTVDFNRAGTPLLEIVSEPEMHTPQEAVMYMKKIHGLVQYLDISDANMQEGSFRCDANVSVRKKGTQALGTKVELKNINSFRFVEKAIIYEIDRHIALLESGHAIQQETRLYDPNKNVTRTMRDKENANDYRYFADPDLLAIHITPKDIESIRKDLPELQDAKHNRFMEQYQLSIYETNFLTTHKQTADYFEETVAHCNLPKSVVNWMMRELSAKLKQTKTDISNSIISPQMLGNLIKRIEDNTISKKIAGEIFNYMWEGEGDVDQIIQNKSLAQTSDTNELQSAVQKTMADNAEQVLQYHTLPEKKQKKLLSYLVGSTMKQFGGKANPKELHELIKQHLDAK